MRSQVRAEQANDEIESDVDDSTVRLNHRVVGTTWDQYAMDRGEDCRGGVIVCVPDSADCGAGATRCGIRSAGEGEEVGFEIGAGEGVGI